MRFIVSLRAEISEEIQRIEQLESLLAPIQAQQKAFEREIAMANHRLHYMRQLETALTATEVEHDHIL